MIEIGSETPLFNPFKDDGDDDDEDVARDEDRASSIFALIGAAIMAAFKARAHSKFACAPRSCVQRKL